MSINVGRVFGIEIVQEFGLKRFRDSDTLEETLFDREDMTSITDAVLKLECELNKRCWRLKKIEVGF